MARNVRTPYVAQVIDYWLDSALAEAFDENELCEPMWTRLLSAAKKSKMDGYVPRGAVVALNLRHWKKTLPILVRYGVVIEESGGWRIRSWLGHNDSQAEIDAQLERKRKNLVEWRKANAGKPAPNEPEDRNETGYEPDLETGFEDDHVPGTNRGRHLTPDTRHLTSSIDPPTTPTELRQNDGGGFLPETKAAIALLAAAEADATTYPIGNRSAWLAKARATICGLRGAELEAAVHRLRTTGHDTSPDAVIAEAARHAKRLANEPGARSWGKSRADLTLPDVVAKAREQWPDDPDMVVVVVDAWSSAQPDPEEVEVA